MSPANTGAGNSSLAYENADKLVDKALLSSSKLYFLREFEAKLQELWKSYGRVMEELQELSRENGRAGADL